MKRKLKEWFKRYAFAEAIAIAISIPTANVILWLSSNYIISGIITTFVESVTFYSLIVLKDLNERRHNTGRLRFSDYMKQLRKTFIEFGPAEYLDGFIIRPFYLSFFPYIIPYYSLAIFTGTMLANITYYIPVIISYELHRKVFRD